MEMVSTEWFERSKSLDIPVIVNSGELMRRFEDYNFGIDSSPITRAKIDRKRLPLLILATREITLSPKLSTFRGGIWYSSS